MKSKYLGKSRVFSEWDVMQGQGRTHPNWSKIVWRSRNQQLHTFW
jgi:hypothetical protein